MLTRGADCTGGRCWRWRGFHNWVSEGVIGVISVRRFLRHGRALKHGLARMCRGGFWPPRRWPTTFRRPHPVIPRQVAPQQSLLLFHWTKSERFPFPFPWGSIGRETGNGSLSW